MLLNWKVKKNFYYLILNDVKLVSYLITVHIQYNFVQKKFQQCTGCSESEMKILKPYWNEIFQIHLNDITNEKHIEKFNSRFG